jgi:hypothetical protein
MASPTPLVAAAVKNSRLPKCDVGFSMISPPLKSSRQESEDRSQEARIAALRSPMPVCPFFCFQQHLRMHLLFLKNGARSEESGVRIGVLRVPFPVPRIPLSRSFVFNNISGCTFIF